MLRGTKHKRDVTNAEVGVPQPFCFRLHYFDKLLSNARIVLFSDYVALPIFREFVISNIGFKHNHLKGNSGAALER